MNIAGWVWTENFRPYLRFLASLTRYDLTDDELAGVVASLDGSSAEDGDWREYVMRGNPEIAMSLAQEVGFDNVQIQFDSAELVGLRAEAAMEIMACYSLRERLARSGPAADPQRE